MIKNKNIFLRIDWITVIIYLALIIFGWMNIYAAVYNEDHSSIFDMGQRYGSQMKWIIIALVLMFLVFLVESHMFSLLSYGIYAFMILLLIAVLIFGEEVKGARSWFEFGTFRVQPAEFAKFATALALSKFISSEGFKLLRINNLMIVGAIILLPAGLIILQNDTGSAIVYLAFIFVLYREGLPAFVLLAIFMAVVLFVSAFFLEFYAIFILLYLIGTTIFIITTKQYKRAALTFLLTLTFITVGIFPSLIFSLNIPLSVIIAASIIITSVFAIIYAFRKKITILLYIVPMVVFSIVYTYSIDYIFNKVLEPHQQTRINVLFGIENDLKGAGYNVHQSQIAIGSGGILGKGFLQGTQTKLNFVPEQDTDFIFCTVGEEWGFVGTSLVIILFVVFQLRILYIAERQRSAFSRIYGYCVASIIFLHFSVNIAMTIGLAPVIGIPLPFFSYGGSSLWAFTFLVFTFLRLDVSRNETF